MDNYQSGRLIDAIKEATRAIRSIAETYKEDVTIKREQWEYTKAAIKAEQEALECRCDCREPEEGRKI